MTSIAVGALMGSLVGGGVGFWLGRDRPGLKAITKRLNDTWSARPLIIKRTEELAARLRSLVWAVLAGVLLAALPTYYALFPPQPGSSDPLRLALFVLWVGIAALAVYLTATREERVRGLIEEMAKSFSGRVRGAQFIVLEELLRSGTRGTPVDFRWRIFLYDDEQKLLLPYFPESELDVLRFAPGQGAVGQAFEAGRPRVYFDAAVSDASLGLTAAQQERFVGLMTVLAAPIKVRDKTIGVLSAIAKPHNEYFITEAGQAVLSQLVQTVEDVLVAMSA